MDTSRDRSEGASPGCENTDLCLVPASNVPIPPVVPGLTDGLLPRAHPLPVGLSVMSWGYFWTRMPLVPVEMSVPAEDTHTHQSRASDNDQRSPSALC